MISLRHILIVDDDVSDVLLTRNALLRDESALEIYSVENGEQCLAFLRRAPPHEHVPCPDLILMDLNMPRMGGLEATRLIRADPALKHIPVVILTTSSAEADVLESYKMNANCFITKPSNLQDFREAITNIKQFWLSVVQLPSSPT